MRPDWVADYLQIPFVERGRTRDGVDCYGLVRLVYADRLGVALPSYAEGYATTDDRTTIAALVQGEVASAWHDVPLAQAQPYDVVVLRLCGQPMHVGLVLDPPYFLHTLRGAWSCVERWDALQWRSRVLAVVRWMGVAAGRVA